MTILFAAIIAFAFFTQSLMGFGGGLIAVPLLSLFLPVKDVVTTVMIFQFSMGLIIFKTWRNTDWGIIKKMLPSVIIGVALGTAALKFIPGDTMRLILAGYIILHLLRTHTRIDLIGFAIHKGGAHLSGLLGGGFNAMIGGGAPAFIIYLKDKAQSASHFRADITAILFLTNIPRGIFGAAADLYNPQLLTTAMIAFPFFIAAIIAGQILHEKVPQKIYFAAVEVILILTTISLIAKAFLG